MFMIILFFMYMFRNKGQTFGRKRQSISRGSIQSSRYWWKWTVTLFYFCVLHVYLLCLSNLPVSLVLLKTQLIPNYYTLIPNALQHKGKDCSITLHLVWNLLTLTCHRIVLFYNLDNFAFAVFASFLLLQHFLTSSFNKIQLDFFSCSVTVQEIVDTELLDKKYNEDEARVSAPQSLDQPMF